jgi:hypothetical protein
MNEVAASNNENTLRKILFTSMVIAIELLAFYRSLDFAVFLFLGIVAVFIVIMVIIGKVKIKPATFNKSSVIKLLALRNDLLFGLLIGGAIAIIFIVIFVCCLPARYA